MTIEEIEKEWSSACGYPPGDCAESEWAHKHADKLIAVAKAAKEHCECLHHIGDGYLAPELKEALKELEKDE
jgi:hypothetical protein